MEPTSPVQMVTAANGGGVIARARRLHEHEKTRIREEIARIPGLMTRLMKPRNGTRWTRAERRQLRTPPRGLSHVSLYLAPATLPFTALMLPLAAWWLDRRRQERS